MAHSDTNPRTGSSWLIVAFVLTIASFLGATLYSERAARRLDEAATQMASNTMPSIGELAAARAEIRNLRALVRTYLASSRSDDVVLRANIERSRSQLDDAVGSYLALPRHPGKLDLWSEIDRTVRTFERSVADGMAIAPSDRSAVEARQSAVRQIDERARLAAAAILGEIERNTLSGFALATEIQAVRGRARRIAFTLDGLSALLAMVVAWLAIRGVRQYGKLRERANAILRRRADEMEIFAGRVAHDIVGPLMTVNLAIDHVERAPGEPSSLRMLGRAQNSVRRVQTIVDGLLRLARAGARPRAGEHTSVVEVLTALEQDLERFAFERRVSVFVRSIPACEVGCSAGVLSSLIDNLVSNAIKYMGDAEIREVTIRVFAEPETIRFEVEDTGPGIPPGLEETIFDPHVRGPDSGQPGIGLGLATVKRVSEAHGGRVGVGRSGGAGSLFWFELPRAPDSSVSRPQQLH